MESIFPASLLTYLAMAISPTSAAIQGARGGDWTYEDLTEVENGKFRCPETYATVAEKTQEMDRFLAWTQGRYPDWTVENIVTFRMAVLKHNSCTKTLSNIREAPQ